MEDSLSMVKAPCLKHLKIQPGERQGGDVVPRPEEPVRRKQSQSRNITVSNPA